MQLYHYSWSKHKNTSLFAEELLIVNIICNEYIVHHEDKSVSESLETRNKRRDAIFRCKCGSWKGHTRFTNYFICNKAILNVSIYRY